MITERRDKSSGGELWNEAYATWQQILSIYKNPAQQRPDVEGLLLLARQFDKILKKPTVPLLDEKEKKIAKVKALPLGKYTLLIKGKKRELTLCLFRDPYPKFELCEVLSIEGEREILRPATDGSHQAIFERQNKITHQLPLLFRGWWSVYQQRRREIR